MNNEDHAQFTALEMSETEHHVSTGGLDFLPSNYDYDAKTPDNYAKTSDNDSTINFDDDVPTLRHRGHVGSVMDKYGMGWLLDQNSTDIEVEDSQPLLEELDIDLTGIKYKIQCVLMPLNSQKIDRSVLRDDPDFWGPLFIVLLFSLLSVYGQFSVVSWIITIWIMGSFLVFVIARVLGGEVTYSQIVGIIGYSLLPLLLTAVLGTIVGKLNYLNTLLRV